MLQIFKVLYACIFTHSLIAQNNIHKKDSLSTLFTILDLSETDLNDDSGEVANISGLFSASDDVYLNTIGFEFQGVFYNARGLPSDQVTFLLNGVHQNRLFDGRPAWSNWGGVAGIYRTQEMSVPLGASEKTIGNALGVTSLTTRASKYRQGTRLSYARSDRSYQNKIAINHAGTLPKNWHYVISMSKRWGNQGYREGTFYDANSLMLSVEKKVNKHHSLAASFLYTPNRRGAAGFYTKEVFDLKETSYNGNWGYQNGKKRNARVRKVAEPLFLLTHTYEKTDKLRWENTVLLQKGFNSYSRIDYNGGINPDPSYYQRLPSYWLSKNRVDYENVYRYEQYFIKNGQLNWEALYSANAELSAVNKPSAYVLYDDKREEQRIQFNCNITKKINEFWQLNACIDGRSTISKNYAEVIDVLGGDGYLDVASFTLAQTDLNHPNRIVQEGDKFKYNYRINSSHVSGFFQSQWKGRKIELAQSVGVSYTLHQRDGGYKYENYANSEGKSKKVNLLALQGKVNALYKFSGRNLLELKSAYIQRPPYLKQVFPNARVNNNVLKNIDAENLFSNSLSYIRRGLNFNIKLTGYYNLQSNVTETGFYFAEGFGTDADDVESNLGELQTENSLFVQEVMNSINKKYAGLELGTTYNLNSSFKFIGVLGIGNYLYANNPNLFIYTEDDITARNLGFINGEKDVGVVAIKNKKLATGPQQAFSLKLAYIDPDYWRLNISVNHFRNNYVDITPIKYTTNFTYEINGDPIENIDLSLLSLFRAQEQLKNFTLVNLSGGKSWRIKKSRYLSLFWTVQNILGINYQTGGFASSRTANYNEQLQEHNREQPLFGNRYFVGNGRTFFTGIYYSF